MFSSYTPLLKSVIDMINDSITAQDVANVHITQVNLLMPDGKTVSLFWQPEAFKNDDDTFRGDWDITINQ